MNTQEKLKLKSCRVRKDQMRSNQLHDASEKRAIFLLQSYVKYILLPPPPGIFKRTGRLYIHFCFNTQLNFCLIN